MKLVQAEKTFETNAEFTSQDFTIGDVSVVIEILRNKLYRHKVRTLVQEYISNARDATREINGKKQIEITLPTTFTPTFKVRDFGPGISPDRMYNVFIKYAASTKRDSNKQTGGFGIGAKSAWSYTESFTIVTFIDGVQRSYIAHIGANNNGRLDFLGETKTTEQNGTEIQIPVSPKDVHEFKQSAYRAVYFWNKKEQPIFKNLTKDDKPEYIQGDMLNNLEINSKLPGFIISEYNEGIVISIDGIPYVAEESLIEKIPSLKKLTKLVTGRLVLHVPNGELEVSASREEISDSKHTLDNLEVVAKDATKVVETKIKGEFGKATTPFEYLTVYMKLKEFYNLDAYRTFGDFNVNPDRGIESKLFEHIKIDSCNMAVPSYELTKESLNKKSGRRYSWRHNDPAIKAKLFDKLYYCDGTETAIVTNYRIKALLANTETVVIFTKLATDTGQYDKVIAGLGLKDLKTISYVKPARKSRDVVKVERTKKEFCLHRLDRWSHRAVYTTLETNKQKWLYVDRADENKADLRDLNDYLQKDGWKVCSLGQDAMRRVKGDKNFKPLTEYLATYKVSTKDIAAMKCEIAQNYHMMEKLCKLTGLTDKSLSDMINEYKSFKEYRLPLPKMLKDVIGKVKEVDQFKTADTALTKDLKSRFSLLENIQWQQSIYSEITCYINSK